MEAPMRALALVLLVGCSSVTDPEPRAQLDLSLGTAERDGLTFRAGEGLLHAVSELDGVPVFRASCPEFEMTIEAAAGAARQTRLVIRNVPLGLRLSASAGVLGPTDAPVAGTPVDGLHLGLSWNVTLPAGLDRVTLRTTEAARDFTFLAFGDIQRGLPRFGDVVEVLNARPDAEFIVVMGDLTNVSTEPEFDAIERAFDTIRLPMVLTPGNHDAYRSFAFQERFGRANYSCVARGVRFTSLDSSNAGLSETGWRLYDEALEAGKDQPHVVFSHIPATETFGVRSGQWNSRVEARRFVASTASAGVDLILFGHLHTLDRYELGGVPTVISGGAGALEERLDGIDRHVLEVRVTNGQPAVEVVRVDP
jgi:predicted phosphodiesterase